MRYKIRWYLRYLGLHWHMQTTEDQMSVELNVATLNIRLVKLEQRVKAMETGL